MLFEKSKTCLAKGGFSLHKFKSISIESEEHTFSKFSEDLQYLADATKVLGLKWEKGSSNTLIFYFKDIKKHFTNILTK